jgi:hypothetical protein
MASRRAAWQQKSLRPGGRYARLRADAGKADLDAWRIQIYIRIAAGFPRQILTCRDNRQLPENKKEIPSGYLDAFL